MEVRGPFNQNVQSSEYSKLNGKQHRIEAPIQTSSTAANAEHLRSSEFVQLVDQLRELPEVREDVVSAVREKLDSGVYQTRENAEQTAAVILNKLQ